VWSGLLSRLVDSGLHNSVADANLDRLHRERGTAIAQVTEGTNGSSFNQIFSSASVSSSNDRGSPNSPSSDDAELDQPPEVVW